MNTIKYKMVDDIDHVLDEKGNTFTALRKIAWGNSEEGKYEVRKWYMGKDGEDDTPGKGCTLTEEAANELPIALLKENFGDTEEVIEAIKDRKDFIPAINKIVKGVDLDLEEEPEEEEYYEVEDILA